MDAVDQKQQQEIDALRDKNTEQDIRLGVWTKLYLALFVIVIALFVGGVILMPLVTMRDSMNCPHPDCVHHRK